MSVKRNDWSPIVNQLSRGETVLIPFDGHNHVDGIRSAFWAHAKKHGYKQTSVHLPGVGLAVTWTDIAREALAQPEVAP